jgi:hypothetical protein
MSDIAEIKRAENSHIWQREQTEHYVEPEWCSRRLFAVEKFDGMIADPCCGFGRIPDAAKAAGHYPVRARDIVDRGYVGMPRTPAKVTQADIARALRAARQAGGGAVEIRPDGTIVIRPDDTVEIKLAPLAAQKEIVL